MRLVRSEMLEVMRTDYIKFARARGLSNRAINFGHALKNTLVPVITVDGPAARRPHRLRHRHRDGVRLAGRRPALHPVGAVLRHPGDGGLPAADRAAVRGHQPRRRPALLRRRSAPAQPGRRGRAWRATDDGDAARAPAGWLHRADRQRRLVELQVARRSRSPRRSSRCFIFAAGVPGAAAGAAHAVRPGDAQPQRRPEAAGPGLARRRLDLPARHRRPGPRRAVARSCTARACR